MAIINWKHCYATGISVFDDEHRGLVAKINALYETIRAKDAAEKLPAIIDALVDYTLAHFSHEERLMAEHGYPELEEHRKEHEDLKAKVAEYKAQLSGDDPQLPLNLFNFLREWLLHHIVEVDHKYREFFKEKGIG